MDVFYLRFFFVDKKHMFVQQSIDNVTPRRVKF